MPPNCQEKAKNGTKKTMKISLGDIKKLIPAHCFQKSLNKSLAYMIRDLLILASAFWTYQYLPLIVFWNFYGFIMWCLFVVGHDCGHQSFSNSTIINDICGHICHTLIMVPYWPWRYSHWKHHIHHNHHKKDRSHPWETQKEFESKSLISRLSSRLPTFPFIAWAAYLYLGWFDGSHLIPSSSLYKDERKNTEKLKNLFSNAMLAIYLFLIFGVFKVSWSVFMIYYVPTWIVFGFWLFMVTYLQHHTIEGAIVYDDSNWNFVIAGLETVDRKYGFGIDNFHHNISDCHVVHHLFFSKIPHYNLKAATNAIRPYLESKGLYKYKAHDFVFIDFWRVFFIQNFIGKLSKN